MEKFRENTLRSNFPSLIRCIFRQCRYRDLRQLAPSLQWPVKSTPSGQGNIAILNCTFGSVGIRPPL